MKVLEERILKDGTVKPGNVLKVDNFINHQLDVQLFQEMAKEWKRLFGDKKIDKILTIEASGIAIASIVALEYGVPVVFAKKYKSINITEFANAYVPYPAHNILNTLLAFFYPFYSVLTLSLQKIMCFYE